MTFQYRLIYDYMHQKEIRLENYVTQLANNVVYRKADPVDHLEMIIAQTRLEMAREVFSELYTVLAIMRHG